MLSELKEGKHQTIQKKMGENYNVPENYSVLY